METISSKDSCSGKRYIAFFDLDHTIISSNSGRIITKTAHEKGLMSNSDLIRGIWLSFLYRYELRDTVKIIDSMVAWLKGVKVTDFNDLALEVFNTNILNSIRPEIKEEIIYHKNEEANVVILSSALHSICKPVADYLGMDDILCSNLEINNNVFTGFPSGSFCFGKEKVNRLLEYCKYMNINPLDSWYYGDSIADLPVLETVGNPVCVYPDRKLLKVSRERGWKVLSGI
jgi:putative phosphoserine phosphatase/1-acylglycerol-3-phosphate O-acyltransferase